MYDDTRFWTHRVSVWRTYEYNREILLLIWIRHIASCGRAKIFGGHCSSAHAPMRMRMRVSKFYPISLTLTSFYISLLISKIGIN